MTAFLGMLFAALMILVGVALITFDIFARVFNNIYSRMFMAKRASHGYGYSALVVLILLYVAVKVSLSHH